MRVENWPVILAAEIQKARKRAFSFGRADCALWAADVVQAITGADPAAPWRGSYGDRHGALKLLAQFGGLREAATALLGEPIATSFAQRGDVVLLAGPEGYSLGICEGALLWAMGEEGIVSRPIGDAICAWRV